MAERTRTILITGKGGVGKTTVAAATALLAARQGKTVLVISTDPAHSLADALDLPVGGEPTEVAPGLFAQQVESQGRLEQHWQEIKDYLTALLGWVGAEDVAAEELTVLPGLDEIFGLTEVRRQVQSGLYDAVVVDCAPTAETLRLLALPEALSWYLERLFPVGRRVVGAVRPILSRITTMPIAGEAVFDAVERVRESMDAVRDLLQDPETSSVRLVTNAERMVLAEARRTYTYLSLFGYPVEAVIVNKVIPEDVTDPYFAGWKESQAHYLESLRADFAPLRVLVAPLERTEVAGVAALEAFGRRLFGSEDPLAFWHRERPLSLRRLQGRLVLSISLPLVEKGDLELWRGPGELHIKVGGVKRVLALPDSLKPLTVEGAQLKGGRLEVRFTKEG